MDVASAILGLVLAILWAEASAWLPTLTRRIVRMAAMRLEPDLRDRMEEEWLRYVEDMPGTFGPFFAGCQCLVASVRICPVRVAARRLQPATKGRRSIVPPQVRQLYFERLKAFLRRPNTERVSWIAAIAIGSAFSAGIYLAGLDMLARLFKR